MNYNFRIDQKYELWKQFHYSVEAETKEEAIEIMKEEFQRMDCDPEIFQECEIEYDTETEMSPVDNGGASTRELYYKSDSDPIAINGEFYCNPSFDEEHYLEVDY